MKALLAMLLLPSMAFGQVGMASWYGLENHISSTGKRLSRRTPAVAHRTLPIGTKVRVTSIRSKKSVVAVVEDRGPFTKNRVVDLNRVAASKIGMLKDGITKVKLEIL
jgi:rare lipoprotein A